MDVVVLWQLLGDMLQLADRVSVMVEGYAVCVVNFAEIVLLLHGAIALKGPFSVIDSQNFIHNRRFGFSD